jgi:uncharacterized protein (DUF952 family)
MSRPLFHIVAPEVWPQSGSYRPESLTSEGFVHLSFADQVEGVANNLYPDEPELVVMELDPAAVGAEVRIEDSYGSGTEFPHLYGPLPVAAAVHVHPLRRDPHGRWTFSPDAGAGAPASRDR